MFNSDYWKEAVRDTSRSRCEDLIYVLRSNGLIDLDMFRAIMDTLSCDSIDFESPVNFKAVIDSAIGDLFFDGSLVVPEVD